MFRIALDFVASLAVLHVVGWNFAFCGLAFGICTLALALALALAVAFAFGLDLDLDFALALHLGFALAFGIWRSHCRVAVAEIIQQDWEESRHGHSRCLFENAEPSA